MAPPAKNLMGSEVVGGVRVCEGDSSARQSDIVLGFSGAKKPKIDECSLFVTDRGSDGKQVQRKVGGKVPHNGSGSFRKLRLVQADNVLPPAGNDDTKIELDMPGSHLVKCSSADKSLAVKQRNSINCRRIDRRNSKVPLKATSDPLSMLAGMSSFSPAAGMYGLKSDVHDVTKFFEDISLNELLDRTYKCPILGKDKGMTPANLNDDILATVRKACSFFQVQGMHQGKQCEEVDINGHKKTPMSSPSNNIEVNGSDGDGFTAPGSSKLNMELEVEDPAVITDSPVSHPRDILERLELPPPKDLESLWQDAVKSASSMKPTDSRSSKQLSRVSLPPFQWSHNFNGHHKSYNDPLKSSNRSTCLGRWIRITSTASFIGGGAEGFVDLDSLTYDDSLVPAGQLRYRLPENGKTSSICVSWLDVSSAARSAASLPPREPGSTRHPKPDGVHSPRVLAAAQTLCDMATHYLKYNGGILKWPKQPSQKPMKALKTRLNEIPVEEFLTPKSETVFDHVVRSVEYGSTSKRPRISLAERREEISHVQAVLGLSSVSAPRSNRSSPSRLSRDSVPESRHSNGNYAKTSFLVPPPLRAFDRSSHRPQKLRKVTPTDWNRSRS